MPATIKAGLYLTCGCCGCCFQTWEGYVDQDQDLDHGICRSCQGDNEARTAELYNEMYQQIHDALSPEKQRDMEAKVAADPSFKTQIVNHMMDKGAFTWKIGA